MLNIKCIVFKVSGKYYTDETVLIPDNTPDYEIPNEVRKNRFIKDMIYVGETLEHKVPFLVKPTR